MKNYFLIPLLFFVVCGCRKIISIPPPVDQLVTTAVFRDTANAKSAVIGIYASMMNNTTSFGFCNGALSCFTGLAADELLPTGTNAADLEFYKNGITPENSKLGDILWKNPYKIIYQLNACIEGLTASETLKETPVTDSIRKQLLGECFFTRAYLYFNLVNLYGAIPIVLGTDYRINTSLPRAAVSTVYTQLHADLNSAINLLSLTPINGRLRPTKLTATALLARLNLYENNYTAAAANASVVISSGSFMLEPNLNDVFLPASREAIWQLKPYPPGYETTEGQLFIPVTTASVVPAYPLSDYLLAAFENGDKRKINNNWIKSKVVGSKTYYHPFKYKLRLDNNTNPLEYNTVLRLAEQYLIRAEANIKENKLADALADINIIRRRSGLNDLLLTTAQDLLNAIEQERRVEFFAEGGQRWFDLKRTGRSNIVLAPIKGANWQVTDILFPIPANELEYNPFLIQNPGY